MFQEMRRKEKTMPEEEMQQLLSSALYGVISSFGENGYPYGIPVNFIYKNGNIYFHCAKGAGHKLMNFSFCSKVCFTVVDHVKTIPEAFSTHFESAIAFGTIEAADAQETAEILTNLIQKYSPDFLAEGMTYIQRTFETVSVYRINVEHITGKVKRERPV